jgi:integrase
MDLVFCKEDGPPIHAQTYSRTFERLVAQMDLPTIRLHEPRHTHATIALKAGIPVKVISERLGHENPAFTMKQYAHVIPGMQAEAAQAIAGLVGVNDNPGFQGAQGTGRSASATQPKLELLPCTENRTQPL